MGTHNTTTSESWLNLVGSPATVLGPSRGHTPDLGAFRVAYMHLSPASLWLYGAVFGLPPDADVSGSNGAMTKFNLALEISLRRLVKVFGQPELDPNFDDSMHGFQLAKPVVVCIRQTDELVWPDATHRVLHMTGDSSHFGFELHAAFVRAFGGKHAKPRFTQSLSVRN